MKPRSLYIIGGAGAGKSTFTAELLGEECMFGELEDLYSIPNARGTIVTLRGHAVKTQWWAETGLYIGAMRDEYPGTDGLDRASSITGEAWLEAGEATGYTWIVSEGATLATRRFLTSLHKHTDLLIVHLSAEPDVVEVRFAQRGSDQDRTFVKNTVTRSQNLLVDMVKLGVTCLSIDSGDPGEWELCRDLAAAHLRLR